MRKGKMLELTKTYDFCKSKEPRLAVVFIHGIAADSGSFSKALEYLSGLETMKDVRFIAVDLLGSGKSLKDDKLEYDYNDQLTALDNAINKLDLKVPLVLVGHSMGTLIATRYAAKNKNKVQKLILISPPVYTEKDLENPAFAAATKVFKDAVSVKNRAILKEKSFNNSMEKIVLDKKNYETLAKIKTPTTLVYGDADQFIAAYNIPRLLKENPGITAVRTVGRHGVSRDKYHKVGEILEELL